MILIWITTMWSFKNSVHNKKNVPIHYIPTATVVRTKLTVLSVSVDRP